MLRALTHTVSPNIARCELTYVPRTPIDLELATQQHEAYCDMLRKLDVTVTELTDNAAYPDCSFVEDTAIVVAEMAIICSMGVHSRRGETALIERELTNYRKIAQVSLPATIEGGDVLRVGKKILVGKSSRTNTKGIADLTRLLHPFGYRVITVKTKDSLHFKSACTALDDKTLFVNPDWVDLKALKDFKLVNTPAEEPWSANVLRVGSAVCVQADSPRAAELLRRVAKRVEVVDTSELRKAEAGLTCSSIIFESEN